MSETAFPCEWPGCDQDSNTVIWNRRSGKDRQVCWAHAEDAVETDNWTSEEPQ